MTKQEEVNAQVDFVLATNIMDINPGYALLFLMSRGLISDFVKFSRRYNAVDENEQEVES